MSLKSLYRVDNVPFALRPFFYLYGYLLGALMYLHCAFVHFTSTIEFEGHERLPHGRNFIFCLWHYEVWAYFSVFIRNQNQVWLGHPDWYMMPALVLVRMLGVRKIVLGSAGRNGRKAADELEQALREGASTMINPDGPAGPPLVAKKGALHLSARTGTPIVPLQIRCTRAFPFPSWDRKMFPLPFNHFKVSFLEPFQVGSADETGIQEGVQRLQSALGIRE